MKSRYIIGIGTCFLFICIVLCIAISGQQPVKDIKTVPLYLSVEDNNGEEDVISAYADGDTIYAFLPSYADLSMVKVYSQGDVYIDNNRINAGEKCDDYQLNKKYKLTVENKEYGNVLFMRSENVAAMYIDTADGSMDRVYKDQDHNENINIRVIDKNGNLNYKGTTEKLSGRGNSSWRYNDKKSFSLDLNRESNLLDIGIGTKWALIANASDETNIRNKMVFDFAEKVGCLAPGSEYVDLYLNGQYNGLYLLSEKIEFSPERINVENNPDNFIFCRDQHKGKYKYEFTTDNNQPVAIKSPKVCTEDMVRRLSSKVQSMENSIVSPEGIDPATGKTWKDIIDVRSWIKKYLIEEIFVNFDAGFNSTYFYWQSLDDGKIFAGSVWDYDGAVGNSAVGSSKKLIERGSRFFIGKRKIYYDGVSKTCWYTDLYKKPEFYESAVNVYRNEVLDGVNLLIDEGIDQYASEISAASEMNKLRWSENFEYSSVDEAVSVMKEYLKEHVDFLNSSWINGVEYCSVAFFTKGGTRCQYKAIEKGVCFDGDEINRLFDMRNDTVWCDKETGEVFDLSMPVTMDMQLCPAEDYKAAQAEKHLTIKEKIKVYAKNSIYIAPFGIMGIVLIVLIVFDRRQNSQRRNRDE